jgi:hypothetical protein
MDAEPELGPVAATDRLRRVVVVVVLAAVFAYLAWVLRHRGAAEDDGRAATLCTVLYQRARSAADTAMVDGQRPMISGEDAPAPRSCAELRGAGRP